MTELKYKIESFDFDGPLDLLLTLIQKNKVSIQDIPIALICDQYLAYISQAQKLDLEVASEFLVMASELILIKTKMLLPRDEKSDEKDPRAELADALQKYQQAKEAAGKLKTRYEKYVGRMVKDTDEFSIDKTFVDDQQVTSLCAAVRRIIAYNEANQNSEKVVFSPMISKPIVPVEAKIVGILHRMKKKEWTPVEELLSDSVSHADMIAIFLGVLELLKVRDILLDDDDADEHSLYRSNARVRVNPIPADQRQPQNQNSEEHTDAE
ncbi:MAG: segregation/condensation protein A [Clostridia bacterium]|nr:segregation/condensation protein A [Clostridia bacterium]